jgi:hypothetical protein
VEEGLRGIISFCASLAADGRLGAPTLAWLLEYAELPWWIPMQIVISLLGARRTPAGMNADSSRTRSNYSYHSRVRPVKKIQAILESKKTKLKPGTD